LEHEVRSEVEIVEGAQREGVAEGALRAKRVNVVRRRETECEARALVEGEVSFLIVFERAEGSHRDAQAGERSGDDGAEAIFSVAGAQVERVAEPAAEAEEI